MELHPHLYQLLHKLVDHAVPQGNDRGELHAQLDALEAPPADAEESAEPDPAPPAKFATPKVNGPASS